MAQPGPHDDGSEGRLDGWKEIAAHFGRTVRTIQRWERDQGLPVRRLVHATGATVYAFPTELEDWRRRHTAYTADRFDDGAGAEMHDADALYRMSRHHWLQRTKEGFRRSLALARTALQRDPTHAPSYAMLALVYATRASYGHFPPVTELDLAREAAMTALKLDSTVIEAHQALGFVHLYYDWDFTRARDAFETALRLNPSDPSTPQWFSVWFLARGLDEEACSMAQRAEDIDGGRLLIYSAHAAWMLHHAGRLDEAVAKARTIIRRDPNFWRGYFNLALSLIALGRYEEARATIEIATALTDNTALVAILVHALVHSGQRTRAEAMWRHLFGSGEYVSPYWTAVGAVGWRRTDDVLERLTAAVGEREWFVLFLNHEPAFRELRPMPAYARLCRMVGLP